MMRAAQLMLAMAVAGVAVTSAQYPAHCSDGVLNGGEMWKDCGGPCEACECPTGTVLVGNECALARVLCDVGATFDDQAGDCVLTATCTDGIHNGDESDVDCGGSCPRCSIGEQCSVANDCDTGLCANGFCNEPDPNACSCGAAAPCMYNGLCFPAANGVCSPGATFCPGACSTCGAGEVQQTACTDSADTVCVAEGTCLCSGNTPCMHDTASTCHAKVGGFCSPGTSDCQCFCDEATPCLYNNACFSRVGGSCSAGTDDCHPTQAFTPAPTPGSGSGSSNSNIDTGMCQCPEDKPCYHNGDCSVPVGGACSPGTVDCTCLCPPITPCEFEGACHPRVGGTCSPGTNDCTVVNGDLLGTSPVQAPPVVVGLPNNFDSCANCFGISSGPCQSHDFACHGFFGGQGYCPTGTVSCTFVGTNDILSNEPFALVGVELAGLTREDFDETAQDNFKVATAGLLGTTEDKIVITAIKTTTPSGNGRKLADSVLQVQFIVLADNPVEAQRVATKAAEISQSGSSSTAFAEALQNAGVPVSAVVVPEESVSMVENPTPLPDDLSMSDPATTATTTPTSAGQAAMTTPFVGGDSSGDGGFSALPVLVGGFCVVGLIVGCVVMRRRRSSDKVTVVEPITADGKKTKLGSRVLPSRGSSSSPRGSKSGNLSTFGSTDSKNAWGTGSTSSEDEGETETTRAAEPVSGLGSYASHNTSDGELSVESLSGEEDSEEEEEEVMVNPVMSTRSRRRRGLDTVLEEAEDSDGDSTVRRSRMESTSGAKGEDEIRLPQSVADDLIEEDL